MPGFSRDNDTYFVSYVTGPSHVRLGLAFAATPAPLVIHRESRKNSCNHGPLDESRIREAVVAGVAHAAKQLYPVKIIYLEGDSPRYELFEHCARLLARRVAAGEPFDEVAKMPPNKSLERTREG